jgi:hypothetical protein
MVEGLHETTSSLAASFDQGPVLIYTNADFAASRIGAEILPGNDTEFVAFCFANVTLWDYNGRSVGNVYAVSVYDPDDSLGLNMTNESVDQGVLIGTQIVGMLAQNGIVAVPDSSYMLTVGNSSANIRIDSVYSTGSIFPDDWLLVPRHVMDALRPDLVGDYSFMMVIEPGGWELPPEAAGLQERPTTGVVGFFEEGIYQVERGLWGIILISGVMVSLLVYCIISIETEYSAPTIRILRGIGASRAYVVQVFMLKALFITIVGGVLGTALGFCAASAISSISNLLDIMTFITPVASLESVALPVAVSAAAGAIGGLWPAIRASRMFATGGE